MYPQRATCYRCKFVANKKDFAGFAKNKPEVHQSARASLLSSAESSRALYRRRITTTKKPMLK